MLSPAALLLTAEGIKRASWTLGSIRLIVISRTSQHDVNTLYARVLFDVPIELNDVDTSAWLEAAHEKTQ
jgi:hypothetical protein